MKYRFNRMARMALVASVVATLFACSGKDKESSATTPITPSAKSNAAPLVTGLPDFTVLVDHIAPAVVNIRTSEKVSARASAADPICQMWPDFPLCAQRPQREAPNAQNEVPRGVGSGFIISEDGYILTNHHVVDGASSITVSLNDNREFTAKVIGSDERSDVAVLKIEGEKLPFLRTANSDEIKVGQWVLAAGSPFGLKNTVTAGIVSAIKRDTGEYESFIQTDAAVNPGNSGGPLVNMSGEVVGINSQILSTSGAFAGVALAIPINEALKVAEQIRSTGKVTRGRIGVSIGNIDAEVAKALGLKQATGALIKAVESGSVAANSGLRAGDVVLKIDQQEVANSAEFARTIGNSKPGTQFSFEVWREGRAITLPITVGSDDKVQNVTSLSKKNAETPSATQVDRLGIAVEALSGEVRKNANTGVVIVKVWGAAEAAGLQAGDLILQVNNTPINQPDDFNNLVKSSAGRVLLLVQRDDSTQYVVLNP